LRCLKIASAGALGFLSIANVLLAEVLSRIKINNYKLYKMKLTNEQLKDLMTKHIFLLSEEEVKAVAFILDLKISKFSKCENQIDFVLTHNNSKVIVECSKNSNCSIGRSRKEKRGCYGLTSWGGVFSFASAVRIFRGFFCREYEITIKSDEKSAIYEKECETIVLSANDLVEAA
jgi:hypothetical protein